MKKILIPALSLFAIGAMAQETYEGAQIATQDLNGTAKYIGMGGAMEALGADISTINTNPAGIGLFRRSWIGASAGFTSQNGSSDGSKLLTVDYGKSGKTNADFNQLGFVYSTRTGHDSHINLAFNYQKNRNFNQIMQAVNTLNGSSANMVNYIKAYHFPQSFTLQDDIINEVVNKKLNYDGDGEVYARGAQGYSAKYDNSGYISNFDFNISGSIHDQIYLGLTLGIKDVNYKSVNIYDEMLAYSGNTDGDLYGFTDVRRITGTGIDVKLGAVFRPIEDSPFRFGLYINSPTWYDLKCHTNMSAAAGFDVNYTTDDGNGGTQDHTISYKYANNTYGYIGDYKYCISTPWRFGLSMGHTFGKMAAIGVTYEYADYSAIKNRVVEGSYIDYYGEEHLNTSKDYQMDENNDISLKGVSTLKIGAEIKPVPELAIRFGYNWQGAIYTDEGFKSYAIDTDPNYGSVGAYYSTYDFINWKDTHRLTCGLGINIGKNWALDLAYQYSTQKGEYYPFTTTVFNDSSSSGTEDMNIGYGTVVHNNRHQFNATLGYRF